MEKNIAIGTFQTPLQRQKTKMGEEEACRLELLRGRRGFAICLWVWVKLGLPDFVAVSLQSILILYLLGYQNTKLVMLYFKLQKRRQQDFKTRMVRLMNSGLHKIQHYPHRESPSAQTDATSQSSYENLPFVSSMLQKSSRKFTNLNLHNPIQSSATALE